MGQRKDHLPDAELEVMQAVWTLAPPCTRSQVQEKLKRPMALTTLLTLLTRLTERGFLRAERGGRENLYTPLVEREAYLARESRSFVEKVCGGSIPAFANALCGSGLTREELAELRSLLERDAL